MSGDLNSRTVAGLLAYCDWLANKGYAPSSQVNPWKIAVRKVFETVEGEDFESLDLSTVDLSEYVSRFQVMAGAQYKSESITAYKRRVANALEAHDHYLATGRPPTFRQRSKKKDERDGGAPIVQLAETKNTMAAGGGGGLSAATEQVGMTDFPYPLGDGRMVTLRLPSRLKSDDVNRLCAFIRTLQHDAPEQKQIARLTEEDQQAA